MCYDRGDNPVLLSVDPAAPGADRSVYALVEPRKGFKFLGPVPDDGPWSLCHFAGELVAVSAQSGPWTVRNGALVALAVDPFRNPGLIPFRTASPFA